MGLFTDVLGSIFSSGSNIYAANLADKRAQQTAKMNMAWQKQAAHNSIQWRVEDAKKAGLHPLYSLGTPSFQTTPVDMSSDAPNLLSRAGASIGDAISRYGQKDLDEYNRQFREAQLRKLRAEADFAQTSATASKMSLMRNAVNGAGAPRPPSRSQQLIVGGTPVVKNPGFSDAQDIEDRYGDVGSAVYSVPVMVADAYSTAKKSFSKAAEASGYWLDVLKNKVKGYYRRFKGANWHQNPSQYRRR